MIELSDTGTVAADVQRYKAWLIDLEASRSVHPEIPTSRWFRSETFEAYTRVGPAFGRIPRTPVVCLANIQAAIPGSGVLRAILEMLAASTGELRATHVVVELVQTPRLAQFLVARGFTRWELFPGDTPSFTCSLKMQKSPSRRG